MAPPDKRILFPPRRDEHLWHMRSRVQARVASCQPLSQVGPGASPANSRSRDSWIPTTAPLRANSAAARRDSEHSTLFCRSGLDRTVAVHEATGTATRA